LRCRALAIRNVKAPTKQRPVKRQTHAAFIASLFQKDVSQMKDAVTGREAARLGDTTDHGGKVIEAADNLSHMGIRVALDGHLVECPKCGGTYPIIARGRRTHRGVRVAYLGDTTACGAILIAA
jgi:uncharacterized Zn-binding protein involved in type VI secretion